MTGEGRLHAVLTAGAFGLEVGPGEVMAAQHAHLREMASRDEVDVRVLPVNGVHTAMRGALTPAPDPSCASPPPSTPPGSTARARASSTP